MCFIICLFLALILFQENKLNFFYYNLFSYIDEIFIVFICVLTFFSIFRKKRIYKEHHNLFLLILLFIFVGCLSWIINSFKNSNLTNLIMSAFLACKFFICIICFSILDFKFDIKKYILKIIFLVEKIAIIIGFINFVTPNIYFKFFSFNERYIRFGFESITSCFNHPSTFGWFMLLCSFLHFLLYRYENKSKEKIYAIISVIFALLSFRTKIILGVFISYFVYEFIIEKKDIKKYLKSFFLGLVLFGILFFSFRNVLNYTYSVYFKSEQGITARSALTTTGKRIMWDYFPFGVGFGKYGTWYASKDYSEYYYKYELNNIYGLRKDDSRYSTDTFWPAIMGETGFIGIITYIIILIYVLSLLLKYNREQVSNPYDKIFYVCSILALCHLLVESTGEASFNFSPKNIIVGIFVGISLKDYLKYKYIKNKEVS